MPSSHLSLFVIFCFRKRLLSRIVRPSELDLDESNLAKASQLHDHTYGITSDPLTQFACVFSALIHDVDHSGVPNAQLIKENDHLAQYYKNKSVAEQNSVYVTFNAAFVFGQPTIDLFLSCPIPTIPQRPELASTYG